MQFENALVARVCHDLITPFNAINLGVEAFEATQDAIMLETIKESTAKANAILKFMRELFSSKTDEFFYTKTALQTFASEFLSGYKITFNLQTDMNEIPAMFGKIVLYLSAICKDLMPFGGDAIITLHDSAITCECNGRNMKTPDINSETELTYKTVIQHSLLKQLTQLKCQLIASQEENRIIIKITAI